MNDYSPGIMRLLSYGPELVVALRDIVEQHDKFVERSGNQEDAYNLIASRYELFDKARFVLQKVMGES